jgi:hypothetical protein
MTTKYASPLLGYNNNVRHKGRVFHIQTEDSGAKYGHIITHLFMDGGRILKSVKTSYAEYIGADRMADIVREMMKQQHKAMFIALRDGKFDAVVDETAAPAEDGAAAAASAFAAQPAVPALAARAPKAVPERAPPAAAAAQAAGPVAKPPVAPAPDVSAFADPADGPATIRTQLPEELMLDVEALERAAAAGTESSHMRGQSDLPPPPPNLFRERKGTGKYKVTPPAPSVSEAPQQATSGLPGGRPAAPAMAAAAPVRRSSHASLGGAVAAAAGDRRYAPTRPASIFGQAKPQQGKTIFGEDLISDKSLDEVILSYLAEDLDEKK